MNYIKLEDVKSFKFPAGEVQVDISEYIAYNVSNRAVKLYARLRSSDDIMKLLLVNDALREAGVNDIRLVLPYIPYQQQDRVCAKGEALSIRVFAQLINSMNFTSVTVYDPHSHVAPALINNCKIINNHAFILYVLDKLKHIPRDNIVLVAPDAGAEKKIFDLAKLTGLKYTVARKVRDVKTGEIVSTHINENEIIGKFCIVVDDICVGGRTFIELAKRMKDVAEEFILAVSHGVFSKGIDSLWESGYTRIFTTNSYNQGDPEHTRCYVTCLNFAITNTFHIYSIHNEV